MAQPHSGCYAAAPMPPPAFLAIANRSVLRLDADGTFERLTPAQAARYVRTKPVVVCHAPSLLARLEIEQAVGTLDILELFAFTHPGRFCLPTIRGVAEALGLPLPAHLDDEPQSLRDSVSRLLASLGTLALGLDRGPAARLRGLAAAMAEAEWGWGPLVLSALGADAERSRRDAAFRVWDQLPEWSEHAPEPPPASIPVDPADARVRLARLLGPDAEQRPSQADYASAITHAFQPREEACQPRIVLAEAGTGTGKTLGYIAPASLWAERNGAPVWISTYTRNLQRQLDGELDRLYPDPRDKARKVVIRKGRENYLCLLNLEERINQSKPTDTVALALMVRWAEATRDGDMVGGDFPSWLVDVGGWARTMGLADHRGECIFSGCAHYRKCFIERAVRKARRADIVIANHALVMVQAALGGLDDATQPLRLVFDEGHHVFDAADSAFSADLTMRECAEARRWILGPEGDSRSGTGRARGKGLKRRLEDLISAEGDGDQALADCLSAAHALPSVGWAQRLKDGAPRGETEMFLARVHAQVMARAAHSEQGYTAECDCLPVGPGLIEAATKLDHRLAGLAAPLRALDRALDHLLDDEAAQLDTAQRARIDGIRRSLERRILLPVEGWRRMLAHLTAEAPDPKFIDWFGIERAHGEDVDVGMHRHWVDPTQPFAKAVMESAHGVVITSATLRDGSGDLSADWTAAERRTGVLHLDSVPLRAALPSPFDYASRTRVVVVNDVRKDDLNQVAAAYRELFLAADGGGLGLFTAIARLRAVHSRIAGPLDEAGIRLLAQHVDRLDTSTLVDIFRAEENTCLLGTDAVRDGVDVPGRSLRLIVFDRVPWARPDIPHRARRAHFGGKIYDDMIARLRLKQAYGRLIRRADDHGVFVLLDPMMPSRLGGAFPEGVPVERMGLADAVELTKGFIGHYEGRGN